NLDPDSDSLDPDVVFAIDGAEANNGLTVNNDGLLVGNVRLSEFDDVFDSSQGFVTNSNDDDGEVLGLGGDDILIGGRDRNVLSGGAGDDTLTGGLGVDTFVYAPDALGADVITDFTDGEDLLDVSAFSFGVADLQAVIGGAQQIGAATLLTFAPDNTALLQDVQVAQIDAADFIA
ncbi:MAG: M10 family metallopeptidase C-terminal domain-containing protein, partial [Cyanobacteria bacterium J06639_1]